jgi:DNA-binding response OmpR family regulator
MSKQTTILVVEDDDDLRSYLQEFLSEERYSVLTSGNGSKAKKLVEEAVPDLVILDLQLPDISGESLCTEIKKDYPEIPVIILTGKTNPSDIAANLQRGADDYVTKPFSSEELLARIHARLRKNQDSKKLYKVGDVTLNTETVEVKKGDKAVPLTQTEFQLLHYLLSNMNRVLTRDMILSHVWSYTPEVQTRVVDVYVGYLRKKLGEVNGKELIESVRGFGYVVRGEE